MIPEIQYLLINLPGKLMCMNCPKPLPLSLDQALKAIILINIFLFWSQGVSGQDTPENNSRWVDIGTEAQIYPAGFIISARSMFAVSSHGNLIFRIGYNLAMRENFGEHDNEEGGGPGISVGYRYYFNGKQKGFFVAARIGLWFMNIDWQDNLTAGGNRDAETFIMVVQPTFAGGYQYLMPDKKWAFGLSAAFGIEWNVITNGADVGQGGISILLLSVTKRF